MPETNPQGGFDLSSLSSVLQNEDTLRQLRQMAESMGLGAQLEGALNQMQQSASPPADNPNPSVQPNGSGQSFSDSIPVFGNNANNGNVGSRNNGYNSGLGQQSGNRSRNNGGNGYAPQQNNGSNGSNGGNSGTTAGMPPGLNSLLSNPTALAQLGRVMQAMNNRGPEYTFLSSLKPLLRPEKASKVDQALQIMQMMQALRMVGGSNGAGLSGLMGLPGMK